MSATTANQPTGEQRVLASYETDEGTRQLVAQRVNGTVALSDIPTADHGRVHLVERQLSSLAELEALVADYLQTARRTGRCPMEGWLFRAPANTVPPPGEAPPGLADRPSAARVRSVAPGSAGSPSLDMRRLGRRPLQTSRLVRRRGPDRST